MPQKRARLEGYAWSLAQERIGRSLRELYEQPRDLPPHLSALAAELNEKVEASLDDKRRADCPPRN